MSNYIMHYQMNQRLNQKRLHINIIIYNYKFYYLNIIFTYNKFYKYNL